MKRCFYEKYALLILVLITLSVPIMGVGVKRALENSCNNMKEWLPPGSVEAERHTWFQQNFPMELFILFSWEDCTLHDPRLDVMKHRLLPRRDARGDAILEDWNLRYYRVVTSGLDHVEEMLGNYSSMTRGEAISRLQGSLIGMDQKHTSMMILLEEGCDGKDLKNNISDIYRLARRPFVFQKSKLTPQQLEAVQEIQKNEKYMNAPEEAKNFIERRNGYPVPQNLTETEKNQANIPQDDLIILPGIQPSMLHLGGPSVDNIAIDVEGNRTLLRLAWMAALVGFIVASLCLRSIRLVAIVFCAALLATGYSMAALNFSGGAVDAIMLSMPPLVYVLTMSGAIHFINYYHDALEEYGVKLAPGQAVKMAAVPVCISTITTALGLFSLMTSNIGPIYNFGLYSAIGVLISTGFLFLYLPSVLELYPSHKFASNVLNADGTKAERKEVIGSHWQAVGNYLIYKPKRVIVACSIILVLGLIGIPQIIPSVKLMKFFQKDTTIIRDYSWLEQTLGPLVPMEIVIRFDNQINRESMVDRLLFIRDISNAVKTHKTVSENVGGVLSAGTLTPDVSARSTVEKRTMNRRLTDNYYKLNEYVTYDLLSAERKYKAAAEAKNQTQTSPSLEEMGIEDAALRETLKALRMETLEDLRMGIELAIADDKITREQYNAIKQSVFQWQIDNGDELWRVTCRVWALTDLDYGYFVNDLREAIDPVVAKHNASEKEGCKGVEAIYTGSVPLVYQTQHELFNSLIVSIITAFLTISVVMMIMLRNIMGGFISMIPNIFPIAVVFGAMGWFHIRCDLGAMMTASVALGIATDDTIHYLTWYRRALSEGLTHRKAALSAYRRCATAMTQTTLVSAFGLSVFAFSTFTPTLYFGIMMLILMFMALVGDLIYLPSLLIVSGGTLFSKGEKVEQD